MTAKTGSIPSDVSAPVRRRLGLPDAVGRLAFRDRRFWGIQALIVLIATAHAGADIQKSPTVGFLCSTLFFIPVTYAAVAFGFVGAALTALWCLLLDLPILLIYHQGAARLERLYLLAAMISAGVYVAHWVDREAAARAAMQLSQRKYRSLFETSPVPALLLDTNGVVHELNVAAALLAPTAGGALEPPLPLREIVGPEAAETLMESLRSRPDRTEPVAVRTQQNRELWLEPIITRLRDDLQATVFQVQLRDVTEERRRQDSLRTYARATLRGQEDERQRLAQDLHDGIIQDLMVHCRRLDELERAVRIHGPQAAASVQSARRGAGRMVQKLREVIHGLRPAVLDDLGLVTAVREIVARYQQQTGAVAEFRVNGTARRLPAEAELGLFRIAQEAMHNVERHARATHLCLELTFGDRQVGLRVTDDGIGFILDQSRSWAGDGHLGLLGMRERADLLGGDIEILTSPQGGTQISVRVPV